MARHVGKHGARHSLWGGVAVFVVIALTGFLLSTKREGQSYGCRHQRYG